jgi:hypothetical protein
MSSVQNPQIQIQSINSQIPNKIVFPKNAQNIFESAVKEYGKLDPYSPKENLSKPVFSLTNKLGGLLSQKDREVIKQVGSTGNPPFVLLENVPVGTPNPGETSEQNNVTAWSIHALAGLMGHELKSSRNEHGGNLVHNINPDPNNVKMHSTNSSLGRKALAFHIENPYARKSDEGGQPGTPDGLVLVGVTGLFNATHTLSC